MWQLGIRSIPMFGTTVAKLGVRGLTGWPLLGACHPCSPPPLSHQFTPCQDARCTGRSRRLSVSRNTGSMITIGVVPLSSLFSVLPFNFPTGSSLPTPPGYDVTVRGFYLKWLMKLVDTRSNVIFVQLLTGTPAPCRLVAGARSCGLARCPVRFLGFSWDRGGGPCEQPQGHRTGWVWLDPQVLS